MKHIHTFESFQSFMTEGKLDLNTTYSNIKQFAYSDGTKNDKSIVNEGKKHKDLEWLKLPPNENAIEQVLTLATTGKCSMPTNYSYHEAFNKLKEMDKITVKDGIVKAVDANDPIWKLMWNELRTSSGQMTYMK